MSENLMNSAHKSNSDAYRDGWERTFHRYEDTHIIDQRRRPHGARPIDMSVMDDKVFKWLTQDMSNA